MYLEDLIILDSDKDTSKSCIFGFPDRPPDTLPPSGFPINPPDCFPYCVIDDWPPGSPPPGPIVIPPGTTAYPAGYDFISGSSFMSYARTSGYQSNQLYWYKTIVTIQMSPTFTRTIQVHQDGNPTPINIGGLETDLDHAYSYSSGLDNDSFDIQITNLLDYIDADGGGTPNGVIKIVFESKLFYSPDYAGGTVNDTLLYLINLPHSLQSFFGGFNDFEAVLPDVNVIGTLGFNSSLALNHYGDTNKYTLYFDRANGTIHTEDLEHTEGIYIP